MPFTASAGARAWSSCGTRTTSRDDLSDHVGTQGTHHLAAPATARSAERHFHACLACPPRETAGQSVVLGAHARRGVAECAVGAGLQKAVATDADHAQAEPGWQPPDSRLDQRHKAEIAASVASSEKARRNAQRALERAVRVVRQQPSPEHRYAVETARRLVEARWTGLTRLKQEMERGVDHSANCRVAAQSAASRAK